MSAVSNRYVNTPVENKTGPKTKNFEFSIRCTQEGLWAISGKNNSLNIPVTTEKVVDLFKKDVTSFIIPDVEKVGQEENHQILYRAFELVQQGCELDIVDNENSLVHSMAIELLRSGGVCFEVPGEKIGHIIQSKNFKTDEGNISRILQHVVGDDQLKNSILNNPRLLLSQNFDNDEIRFKVFLHGPYCDVTDLQGNFLFEEVAGILRRANKDRVIIEIKQAIPVSIY